MSVGPVPHTPADDVVAEAVRDEIERFLTGSLSTEPTMTNVVNLYAGALAAAVRFIWTFKGEDVTPDQFAASVDVAVRSYVAQLATNDGSTVQ